MMATREQKQERERVANEIDSRMHNLVFDVLEHRGDMEDNLILAYMRAAYSLGYSDCHFKQSGKKATTSDLFN